MKPAIILRRTGYAFGAAVLLAVADGATTLVVATDIFSTQFESTEGYTNDVDLIGQGGWTGYGSGGNGIVSNFIPGEGQQAYVGFSAPAAGEDYLAVWRPLDFNPLAAGMPIVEFSVLINIFDSANGNYDYFRWSVYNTQVDRLFSLDFDNNSLDVSYVLDGTNTLVATGMSFAPGSNYTLYVAINFAANHWSATLNNELLATNQPITTTGARLNLGDIDAEWLIADTNAPGDNFMVFDNYRVTAAAPTARLELLDVTDKGWSLLRVFGSDGSRWAVEATTNLLNWTALNTNVVTGSSFDLVDVTAAGLKQRFYRSRFIP